MTPVGHKKRTRPGMFSRAAFFLSGIRELAQFHCVKYWEIIADNLSKAGWTWGCVSAVDRDGRTIFVADAHRDGLSPLGLGILERDAVLVV